MMARGLKPKANTHMNLQEYRRHRKLLRRKRLEKLFFSGLAGLVAVVFFSWQPDVPATSSPATPLDLTETNPVESTEPTSAVAVTSPALTRGETGATQYSTTARAASPAKPVTAPSQGIKRQPAVSQRAQRQTRPAPSAPVVSSASMSFSEINVIPGFPPIATGRYLILAGSFGNTRDAGRKLAQLTAQGVPAHMQESRGMVHVKVGPFQREEEANQATVLIRNQTSSDVRYIHSKYNWCVADSGKGDGVRMVSRCS
ncbi:MAG: SPOR domain-containing protein [Magnetococcales bacterium]|nr:SPOR domain-containing protein [Magnetococcales bacterium]